MVIGASAGIGLETARQVRAGGGGLILVGRNPERLQRAADELHPLGTAAFDANDSDRLQQFFQGLAAPVDHVMVTAGSPSYRPLSDMDLDAARAEFAQRLTLTLGVALHSRAKVRPGGTLLFMSGTGGRRPGVGMTIVSALTAALSALTANLALEMAPIRVNVIAAGFVDTPLSASLLGDRLEARRQELRDTLPIRRVVGPGRRRAGRPSHVQRRPHRRHIRRGRRAAAPAPLTAPDCTASSSPTGHLALRGSLFTDREADQRGAGLLILRQSKT
ncbi:SDR family NAD(P)-dependent oxidoreductase [Streptomyces sp. RPA4-5]|uniref:SDR family NAD(P)-dependent oxidoreductase n=1 Tax=Streptomyces sp. RPA4-5 TaxID=2721245 RepID=UPI0032B556A2